MAIVKFHCPFAGLSGCHDGSGNGLTKTYLITHLRDRHCKGEAQAITKHALLTDLGVFERTEVTFKRMGIWLCGVCFKTHTIHAKCRHGSEIVPPPDNGDGIVRFVLHDLIKPPVPSRSQLDHVYDLLQAQPDGFTLSVPVLEIGLFANRLHTEESITNAIRSWGVLGGSLQLVRETLAESGPPMLDLDGEDLDLSERNLKQCKRKICDGHYTADVRVLSSSGVAPYKMLHLSNLKAHKHPFMVCSPSLRGFYILTTHPYCIQDVVLDRIKSFPRGNCPTVLGGYIASAPLTPLVKPGGGIRPIVVGTIWRRLVSKVSATMIGHSLDGYLDGLQFGVGVPGEGVAILHAVNRLVEDRGDDVGLSMLLVDYQNAFNLVDRTVMLEEVRLRCPAISRWVEFCYSSPARLYYGEHSLWSCQGVQQGRGILTLTPGADWKVFSHINISRPLHRVKLLGGPVSVDVDFGSALVMKRVSKTIGLLDAVAKINDPQCELLLIRACAGAYCHGLLSATLQTKLLRDVGIVAPGSTFDDALCVFNNAMEIDL
ncbi:hypothetical protein Tco_1170406 [Tanacetum coccineum]